MAIKWNGKLLLAALIGIILYFSANLWAGQDESMEEMGPPKVAREQALTAASQFIDKRFGAVRQPDTDISYQSDKTMSGYVAKNNLQDAYKERFSVKQPLDYWMVRIKDGVSKQSYSVKIAMDEPVVAAWKKEAKPASHDEKGLVYAKKALNDAGYNPDEWLYVPDLSETENTFVFQNKTNTVGDAYPQIAIGVKTGEIVAFNPSFQVPDSYTSWIGSQDRAAQIMSFASLGLSFIMAVVALVYAILYSRHISFVRGIFLTVLIFAIYVFQNMNMVPGLSAGMEEAGAESMPGMNLVMNGLIVVLALFTSSSMYVSLLAGDALWRDRGWHPWPRFRDPGYGRELWDAMGRGYLICFFILGVQQILFLFAGEWFDTFSINDPTQSVYNMTYPALFPTLAWMAGLTEEIVYRLFGIILFKKLLRVNFLAVLVPSVIWALGHTGYTIYPSYTRLFEVTMLGFLFGYAFLKYGLITAIFAHAAMDSLLMGLSLMLSLPTSQNVLIGLFYMALPAIVAYLIALVHRLRYGSPDRPGLLHSPPLPPGPEAR